MTPKSHDHMPITSLWGVAAKWPTRALKTKLILCPRDPQGYSRISLNLSGRILKEYWNIVSALTCGIPWGLQNRTYWSAPTQTGVMRCSKKVCSFELYKLNPLSPHCGSMGGSSCIVIPGVVCKLLQFAATQKAGIVNFFVDHTHTQFTEESNMATALTPQTDVTSGEAYRKLNWLKTQLNIFIYFLFH